MRRMVQVLEAAANLLNNLLANDADRAAVLKQLGFPSSGMFEVSRGLETKSGRCAFQIYLPFELTGYIRMLCICCPYYDLQV